LAKAPEFPARGFNAARPAGPEEKILSLKLLGCFSDPNLQG
jgi:hypothetical protein